MVLYMAQQQNPSVRRDGDLSSVQATDAVVLTLCPALSEGRDHKGQGPPAFNSPGLTAQ
jgi:hypothetical protein